jgi:tetratricopeptide (TPR) repeat protein
MSILRGISHRLDHLPTAVKRPVGWLIVRAAGITYRGGGLALWLGGKAGGPTSPVATLGERARRLALAMRYRGDRIFLPFSPPLAAPVGTVENPAEPDLVMAQACRAAGRTRDAMDFLARRLAAAPDDTATAGRLADYHLGLGDPAAALGVLESAVAATGSAATAVTLLGEMQQRIWRLGCHVAAFADRPGAIRPDRVRDLLARLDYRELGAKAERNFKQALAALDHAEAKLAERIILRLAGLHYLKGEIDEARRVCAIADARGLASAGIRFLQGRIAEDSADFRAAADLYFGALQLRPDFAEAHRRLARIHIRLGNNLGAAQHFDAALSGSPRNVYRDL